MDDCVNCARELEDPDYSWDDKDLFNCIHCRVCGCGDDWIDKAVRKHMRRSGFHLLYCYPDAQKAGRLKIEVVLRGNVLFYIPLWQIKPILLRQ